MQKQLVRRMLDIAKDGALAVTYWDGSTECFGQGEPTCKIILNKEPDAKMLLSDPILTLGEAYMDGGIDLEGSIGDLLRYAYINQNSFLQNNPRIKEMLRQLRHATSLVKQKKDIQHHYDLGNDFFSLWLDETLSYSCAYFQTEEDSLGQAQQQKNNYILKKLQLKPGETLLDIGSGWGQLIIQAAQKYGVKSLGITLSEEQYRETKKRIAGLHLQDQVEVEMADYREVAQKDRLFNKIVSVGMLEHVGKANLPKYFEAVNKLLKPQGLSLLHTITHIKEGAVNSWIEKYIFPGGYIPTLRELIGLMPDYSFHLLDAESLRMHYALTLDHWVRNFEKHAETVRAKMGESFVRMWRLYLQACAASFRYSGLDLHQLLFSKGLNNALPLTRQHLYTN
ncbi:MAG: cyclopropane-fatty-acyl-phospholipid synthase family protein [Clostridia bacterium]|jgi:cyclopropane-fatty-acyl-phospholipid synthase|nr:cyclopropane-fatty-acyl-phospholipid synthase family protein [Clostridia bacterium]